MTPELAHLREEQRHAGYNLKFFFRQFPTVAADAR